MIRQRIASSECSSIHCETKKKGIHNWKDTNTSGGSLHVFSEVVC